MSNTLAANSALYKRVTANTERAFNDEVLDTMVDVGARAVVFKSMQQCSIATGGYVQLLPEMSYMPVLIGNDDQPVYLYQLVEMLEGYLDYDALLAEFPTLNFSQVSGAISFLRKVVQINSRQIDVDELEDQFDTEFIDELRQAFENREEDVRVLTDTI